MPTSSKKADDFEGALHTLIQRTIRAHKRIVFNGNGYDDAWIEEATKVRGLLNLRTTPDALPYLTAAKNVEMLTRHKVYSGSELKSRCEINLDNYRKDRPHRGEKRCSIWRAARYCLP